MKSTKKTQARAAKAQVNYKARFSGETITTPVLFNPTAEEIRKIKELPEGMDIREPSYKKTIKGDEYSLISLLLQYNPNKLLKLKDKPYSDKMFVNYVVHCSPEFVQGAKSGKWQVIDQSNEHAWVTIEDDQSVEDAVITAVKSGTYNDYDKIHKVDAQTARKACVGEVALYSLVFNMSTLDPNVPNKDMELTGFKFGDDPTETFKNFCEGDLTPLNNLMVLNDAVVDEKEFFITNGKQNSLGVFLGVRGNDDNTVMYQDIMYPLTFMNVFTPSTFRPTSYNREVSGFEDLGKTRLDRDAVKWLKAEKYAWSSEWGGSLNFKEMSLTDLRTAEDNDDDGDDDLPF